MDFEKLKVADDLVKEKTFSYVDPNFRTSTKLMDTGYKITNGEGFFTFKFAQSEQALKSSKKIID